MIGFETIGNATITVFDDKPLLVTDPWIAGDAYFGSWTTSHDIPKRELENILACEYVWLSHGHPDHVNAASLDRISGKALLLPDHAGGRMKSDLEALGFSVRVLRDRTWTRLSPRVRVMCIADYNQDGILLIDVNGRLLVDLNDAVDRGWGRFVRNIISHYDKSFLLKLFGYGDADMINVLREDGTRLLPPSPRSGGDARRTWDATFFEKLRFSARYFKTKYLIPFSMFHAYQRSDSAWANEYATPLSAWDRVSLPDCEVLPAFVRYDCENDELRPIEPPPRTEAIRDPSDYGDRYGEPLEADESARITRYFEGNELLRGHLDAVRFRVGGREHAVTMGGRGRKTGRAITFEAPRGSLMEAIDNEVFDDLLIGNFMRTTLHGDFGPALAPNVLYEHFTPFVARYADNGRVKTEEALSRYLDIYRKRAGFDYLVHRLEHRSVQKIRGFIPPGSRLFHVATRAYSWMKDAAASRAG